MQGSLCYFGTWFRSSRPWRDDRSQQAFPWPCLGIGETRHCCRPLWKTDKGIWCGLRSCRSRTRLWYWGRGRCRCHSGAGKGFARAGSWQCVCVGAQPGRYIGSPYCRAFERFGRYHYPCRTGKIAWRCSWGTVLLYLFFDGFFSQCKGSTWWAETTVG